MNTAPVALRPGERPTATPAFYRIGDAFLEVVTDHGPLLEALAVRYGECGVSQADASVPLLRCTATQLPGSPLLLVRFQGHTIPNILDVARSLYWTRRDRQCFVEDARPVPGWRMMVNAERDGHWLLACSDDTVLLDLDEAPPDFMVDCLLEIMQSVQPGVVFVHGASIGVHGSGALFVGHSRKGKSTTALSLASRGHTYLGDDVAAIRVPELHLIPFRTSAALRDGPLSETLGDRIEACGYALHDEPDGTSRKVVRVGDLFPAAAPGPVPLRFAFFLDGFAETPRLTRYEAGLPDVHRLHEMVVSHRPTPGHQLMKFLELVDLLSGLECYLLEVGSPEDTAVMIEGAMA